MHFIWKGFGVLWEETFVFLIQIESCYKENSIQMDFVLANNQHPSEIQIQKNYTT